MEEVGVAGIFTMTGDTIKTEAGTGVALQVDNGTNKVLITGGEIYGSKYGVWITSDNVIITGTAKVSGGTDIFYLTEIAEATVTGGTSPTILRLILIPRIIL